MSTGSIFKNIEITQKHDAKQLINAVENSREVGRERGKMIVKFHGVADFYKDEIVDIPDETPFDEIQKKLDEWLLDMIYDSSFSIVEQEAGEG